MRKFSKIILGTAAVLGIAGTGFTVAGSVMGADMADVRDLYADNTVGRAISRTAHAVDSWDDDWYDDDDKYDDDDWDEDERRAQAVSSEGDSMDYEFQGVSSLDIELSYDELILQETEGEVLKVTVSGDEVDRVRLSEEGSELKIESKGKPEHRTVTVSYPKGTVFGELSIEVGAGTAALENDLEARELSVSVGAGTFENNGVIKASEADMEVGAGGLYVSELDASSIDAECGVGEMTLAVAGAKKDYNYRLSCGVGTIALNEDEFTGLASEKKISNEGASRRMELECGMGTMEVDFE